MATATMYRKAEGTLMVECTMCGSFKPALLQDGDQRDPNLLIQDQWPEAKVWEREQLQSGMCPECQSEFFGNPKIRRTKTGVKYVAGR